MVRDGYKPIPKDLFQVLYSQDATGAVGTCGSSHLFQYHSLYGFKGEVLNIVLAYIAVIVHKHVYRVGVDFSHGERQLVVKGEVDNILLLERALLREGREGIALAVQKCECKVLVGADIVIDSELTADGDILLANHHLLVGEGHEVLEVAQHKDVVYEDHALILVIVPETNINLLACIGREVEGKALPLSFQSFFGLSIVEGQFCDVTLCFHALNDALGEHIDVFLACPDDHLELVILTSLVLLCIESQGAEGIRYDELGSNHPVIALSGWGVHGV